MRPGARRADAGRVFLSPGGSPREAAGRDRSRQGRCEIPLCIPRETLLDASPERRSSVVNVGLDGVDGYLKDVGDLLVGEFLAGVHPQALPYPGLKAFHAELRDGEAL